MRVTLHEGRTRTDDSTKARFRYRGVTLSAEGHALIAAAANPTFSELLDVLTSVHEFGPKSTYVRVFQMRSQGLLLFSPQREAGRISTYLKNAPVRLSPAGRRDLAAICLRGVDGGLPGYVTVVVEGIIHDRSVERKAAKATID